MKIKDKEKSKGRFLQDSRTACLYVGTTLFEKNDSSVPYLEANLLALALVFYHLPPSI